MNFEVTICFVLGASKDSTALLRSVAEQLGSAASYVIVKNKANGPVFELYEASKIREHVREQLGGIEIDLPHILPSTFNTVDKFNLTWGGAENDDRLQLSDRQRVRSFVRNAFAQIDQAKHYLSIVNR